MREGLAERILAFEELLRERFVDQDDLRRAEAIRGADVAAGQDRRAHHPEVVRCHAVEMRDAIALRRVVAGHGDQVVPDVVAHRRDDGDGRGFDAGRVRRPPRAAARRSPAAPCR